MGIQQRRAKQRRYILREKGADKMLLYIVSLTFVIHVALSMHVAVQHAEPFENGLEMDRAIDLKGYRLNIVVFYDDSFANQFKGDAATKEENGTEKTLMVTWINVEKRPKSFASKMPTAPFVLQGSPRSMDIN